MEKVDWAIKYRPKTLSEVIGQQINIELLKDRLSSPYKTMIFYGSSGCGKTTTARALVNDLNAEGIELDAAANNSVDSARDILEYVGRKALTGTYKVVILDECHLLSRSAWNALLKTIEEPPSKVIFIFCTTEYKALPQTILGRSQLFKFYPLSLEELESLYDRVSKEEGFSLDKDVVDLIAHKSKNQARDFLKLLQRAVDSGVTTKEELDKLTSTPPIAMAGAYLTGVLKGESRLAIQALKKIRTPLLEWKERIMALIYEIQEDKYGISELSYSLTQSAKLKKLGEEFTAKDFGYILGKLIKIDKEEEAFAYLFTLALQGIER